MTEDKKPDRSTQFLANERTFLAWLRTSLALIGLGFVVSRFGLFLREFGVRTKESIIAQPSIHSHSSLLGISMVFLGAALIIYALKNYLETNKAIQAIHAKRLTHLRLNYKCGDFQYCYSLLLIFIITNIPRWNILRNREMMERLGLGFVSL